VNLRDYLFQIATTYDRSAGLETETQQLLRDAPDHLAELVPAAFIAIGSGGKGTATFTPWFGFFDPDETTSPERGLYLAFLFGSDLGTVTVTLMQGITELDRTLGRREARARLTWDAAAIQAKLPEEALVLFNDQLNLGSAAPLPGHQPWQGPPARGVSEVLPVSQCRADGVRVENLDHPGVIGP
jgi:hypothetical protein